MLLLQNLTENIQKYTVYNITQRHVKPSNYFHWPIYENIIFSLHKEYCINAFFQNKTELISHMFIFTTLASLSQP